METEKPKFTLEPNLKSAMLPKMIFSLVVTSIIITGIILLSIFTPGGFIVTPVGLVVLALYFLSSLLPTYLDYRNREYRFFSDKLEYFDGWWVINRHVVPYNKVTDLTLTESMWNRMMNTGTIKLITAGSLGGNVYLSHVDNPEQVYNHLQKDILKI